MLVHNENAPDRDGASLDVISYIEEMTIELASLAAKHGRVELAATLSAVAVQAAGERRRCDAAPNGAQSF